ncbi:MAG: BolA/IbaG family iron-sulfur metabolism protein [Gammaproteobacteria bacterium]|nr:BolA/IbaG family iron-sulfur metabolism protein [Gammaproteobacteria bacterium]
MQLQQTIEDKLADTIDLKHLEVMNESGNHNVPPGSESHFKVVLVADEFADMKLVQRHRRINQVLADELAGPVHALAIHAYTEDEWRDRQGGAPMSPPCAKVK